jgi:hypothetical protein
MSEMNDGRPRYADLGKDGTCPIGAAWNVYGRDDQLGSINLLTPERVAAAMRLPVKGAVFPLNWRLEAPDPALFGRHTLKHSIIDLDPVGTEDVYDRFYPQASSQWDGLAHIRHPVHGFYQGRRRAELTGQEGTQIGIEHWARRGIVGRFVLADIARHRASIGRPVRPGETDPITIADIEVCLASQSTRLEPGDILLIRFGWVAWYDLASAETRRQLSTTDLFPCCGLANREETAAWVWDKGLAAVAADNPALEVQPFDEQRIEGYLHYRLIPLLGLAIGELFDLEALAADCSADRRFDGLLVSAPLNKLGGCGSPANAIALK